MQSMTFVYYLLCFKFNQFVLFTVITGNLNVIPDDTIRNIIHKGPKYKFLSNIDLKSQNVVERSLLL